MKAVVSVIGRDSVGIIAKVSAGCAECGANILDISQTVLNQYFTMIMMVDATHCELPIAELIKMMKEEGIKQALDIHIQREDIFDAMHKL